MRQPAPTTRAFRAAPIALMTASVALCAAACSKSDTAGGGSATPKTVESSHNAAAAPSDDGAGAARKESNLRVFHRSLGEPEFLDPGLVAESEGGTVVNDTFEGLFHYGRSHKSLPPGVAESMDVSDDGLTVTFKLRKDAKWSDGEGVTAHDFEWSWKRVLDPKTGARNAGLMWVIEGAHEYNQASDAESAATREKVGIKALDDYTLEVKLVGPTPYFRELTALYTFAPVPRHVVDKHGDKWARPENIVSNGPWKIVEWKSQQRIVAEANTHYWDKASIPFDKIVFHITEENEPAHNMYLSGELDFLGSKLPSTVLPKYVREKFPDYKKSPYLGVYFFMYNVGRKPFDDLRVRRALNMAIEKEKIGPLVVKGQQEEATSIVHPGLADLGYVPVEGDEFDPDEARELLTEAGYPGGKGFPSITITYNTLDGHKLIAEFIQQEWKKNLGIQTELDNMEWKVLLKRQNTRDFGISRSAWIGDYLDPMTFLDLWESDNPQNRTNWRNEAYDELIDQARKAADQKVRLGLLNQAESIFVRELPAIPVYFYVKHDLVKPWLKGYEWHLQGVHVSRYFTIQQ